MWACANAVRHRTRDSALNLNPAQLKRLCITRTAAKPEVIVIDEPGSALDAVATLHVEELMRKLGKGYTIMIVTHNNQQAARVPHPIGFLWPGKLVEFGPTSQIFCVPKEDLTECYITGRPGCTEPSTPKGHVIRASDAAQR